MPSERNSSIPSITTILFDLDGTILDTIGLILASYEHVHERSLAEHPLEADHYRMRLGTPLRGVFAEWVGDDPERIEQLVADYRTHNRQHHDAMVRAFDGVPEMLDGLAARGIRTGIVTSKMRDSAMRGLEIAGIRSKFEMMISIDDVTHHKPHPEPVVRALATLGAQPTETMFVGDAPADIGSGRAAGVRTGAVLWGPFRREELIPHAPHHWFEHPEEILAAL